MTTIRRTLILAVTVLVPAIASAQTPTQQQMDEILKELKAIRQLLERQAQAVPAPPPTDRVRLGSSEGHTLGRSDAPIVMVEFTDLQCPFCSRFARTTFEEIRKAYIDTQKVRFITRDFPIPQLHPHAQIAARSSRCAEEQGKYWEMRTALVQNADKLSPAFITETGAGLKLEGKAFQACLDSTRFQSEIQKDIDVAGSVGITGTPSFVIGRANPDGSIEGVRVVGAQTFAAFEARFKELLTPAGPVKD